ncbi:hypothetical protein LguiA_000446 [Lonicera macranthoides]
MNTEQTNNCNSRDKNHREETNRGQRYATTSKRQRKSKQNRTVEERCGRPSKGDGQAGTCVARVESQHSIHRANYPLLTHNLFVGDRKRLLVVAVGRNFRPYARAGSDSEWPLVIRGDTGQDDLCRPWESMARWHVIKLLFSTDDTRAALQRRGPDSIGIKNIFLYSNTSSGIVEQDILSFIEGEELTKSDLRFCRQTWDCIISTSGEPCIQGNGLGTRSVAQLHLIGATLQLRGINPIAQPLVDTSGNDSSKTMWFGRDAFGRRSLLVHWPSLKDPQFLLSSVSLPSSINDSNDFGDESGMGLLNFWEELSCGVYSISMSVSEMDGHLVGEVKKHEWSNPMLKELIKWERSFIEPEAELYVSTRRISSGEEGIQLGHSVKMPSDLDEIDLLNVSFDGQSAPDRISARAGVKELGRVAPLRRHGYGFRWKLVEIDADLLKLILETKHVMSLINPSNTYMDLNIGLALWLAAGGDGWLCEEITNNNNNNDVEIQRVKYKSESRILLVGSGADEQCAGYGRHKTKYRQGSWVRLHEEMKLDMQRIWKRNLGRDDRCIADNGKEARFPFLDEDVIKTLLDIPLWEIADLEQPSGIGDKKILREVARLLGLHEAAVLPKRAIQFGSRIARESNRKNFGSNRAANQASAGSAIIHGTSNLG